MIGLLEHLLLEGHEVSLFLWAHEGEFMGLLPAGVRLLPELPAYTMLERPIHRVLTEGYVGIALARFAAKVVTALRDQFLGRPGFLLPRSLRYCLPFLPPIPGRYDLVLSFLTPHDVARAKVQADRRVGWIHTDYGSVEYGVDQAFEWPMWAAMDRILAVSEGVRDSFIKVFPEASGRTGVMENILSSTFIRQQAEGDVSAEMPQEPGIARLFSVGRFCHAKNFDSVPQIVRRLGELGCLVQWYLVGFGPDEVLIRRRIAEEGVGDRVIILGKKANPYPYMKACDLYVQPSRYEGKAVTVREAQILGKPVLITAYDTAPSQIRHGEDGWICSLDPQGIAEAIQMLLTKPGLMARLAECGHISSQGIENDGWSF
ncbi:glycosyltransferase [Geothrix paludis]|uniref:glycosyltransferase n=1 Tax=Geothrix paludis TaxID=2922722 RepID=UPI001FAE6F3F|nr:glycosyltransferase [Geothrix paludis]